MEHREVNKKYMSVKIRLQRYGRKKNAYYHIVVADSRAPRDGKFIERIGDYNPNTNPATINLQFEKAVKWMGNGAQPTDTCRAILSYRGVLYKHHLNAGVRKGALTEEQAEGKFQDWLKSKEERIQGKREMLAEEAGAKSKSRLQAESKVSEERAKRIAAKKSPVAEEEAAVEASAEESNTSAEETNTEAEGSTEAEGTGEAEGTTEAENTEKPVE